MPPEDNKANAANLTSEELGLIQRWIEEGAKGKANVVMAAPKVSMGMLTGVPWKFAPVRTTWSSGRKMGLSPMPLASISICWRVHLK